MATRYADGGGIVVDSTNPTSADDRTRGYFVNTIWRNSSTNQTFQLVDDAIGEADWRELLVMPASAATGDVLYVNSSGVLSRLALGTAGQVLTVNDTADGLEWATPA